MMIFLSIKPSSTYEFDKSAMNKAKQARECIKNHSYEKFKNIKKIKEFKILMNNVYNYSLDELLSSLKTIENDKERYMQAFEELLYSHK